MKVRGIVALSMLAALALVAVACGAAAAEVKVDKGLAAIAGVNSASVQRQSNQGSESAAPASLGGTDASAAYAAQVPATGGLGTAAARSAVADLGKASASSGSLAPLEQAGPLGIVVQGYGRATAPADTALIQFTVSKYGMIAYSKDVPSVAQGGAVGQGSAPVEVTPIAPPPDMYPTPTPVAPITEADLQPLVDAIKAQGVSDSDIKVTIYPSGSPYGGQTASVAVTLGDPSRTGDVINAANQALAQGGTISIQNVGVTYSVSDCDALLKEARKAAVEDARANGAGLADALGVGLGGIQGASEYSYDPLGYSACQPQSGPMPYYQGPSYDPAQPAQVQIISNVTISFAIS